MPPKSILPIDEIPQSVLVDLEGLRKFNPQRFEMEQLTAITLLDTERRIVAGYKDVRDDEFWVRGHMPGYPLLPGVLMCEAAAQLCAYYCVHAGVAKGDFVGFGGMDAVRFRGPVHPGQRLWIIGQSERHNPRRMVFEIQGFVDQTMVFNGKFIGVSMTERPARAGDDPTS